MNRLRLLITVSAILAAPAVVARSEPQAKLSREELSVRVQAAGDDPVRLLELCPLADDTAASGLRVRVHHLLVKAAAADCLDLARKAAPYVAAAARTPQEVRQLLGDPEKLSRQVVYRRYLEQWSYQQPLPLCLLWSVARGENARLVEVHPIAEEKQ
jgi:hypothetical protein